MHGGSSLAPANAKAGCIDCTGPFPSEWRDCKQRLSAYSLYFLCHTASAGAGLLGLGVVVQGNARCTTCAWQCLKSCFSSDCVLAFAVTSQTGAMAHSCRSAPKPPEPPASDCSGLSATFLTAMWSSCRAGHGRLTGYQLPTKNSCLGDSSASNCTCVALGHRAPCLQAAYLTTTATTSRASILQLDQVLHPTKL